MKSAQTELTWNIFKSLINAWPPTKSPGCNGWQWTNNGRPVISSHSNHLFVVRINLHTHIIPKISWRIDTKKWCKFVTFSINKDTHRGISCYPSLDHQFLPGAKATLWPSRSLDIIWPLPLESRGENWVDKWMFISPFQVSIAFWSFRYSKKTWKNLPPPE